MPRGAEPAGAERHLDAHEVTARKRAEKASKMGKTRLSVILEATQIAIWDWDIKRDRWRASRT